MTERIVVDTTAERKAALEATLEYQGESIKNWFEDQITTTYASTHDLSGLWPDEISSEDSIANPKRVLADLAARDWAFTDSHTGYLTHDIHPYPAKFIPQIPAVLISRLSIRGDLVLDPFGGSGTTAVEAVKLGRRALSCDANPLTAIIGRVKTGYLDPASNGQLHSLTAALETYLEAVKTDQWVRELLSRHAEWAVEIPNIEKWFQPTVIGELSLIKHLIAAKTEGFASDVASVALSRIIVRVSNQDSETRYVASSKSIRPGFALRAFAEALKTVRRKLELSAQFMRPSEAEFASGDSRTALFDRCQPMSVGLIVSSPPYPNATDYHLYHRFRMFWLGHDPRALAPMEIGSHLKHQREGSSFESYCNDMGRVFEASYCALQPSRYAAFVVGDAVFKGEVFQTAEALAETAKEVGFSTVGIIERAIHGTKRSFTHAARRARTEKILLLQRPDQKVQISLGVPGYKMWPYEAQLRRLETETVLGCSIDAFSAPGAIETEILGSRLGDAMRLTFTKNLSIGDGYERNTWQRLLENGDMEAGRRKEPKYATHGLHPYKGKFYPQLAKSLMNIAGARPASVILDPFCGSGTVPLECLLNGYRGYGLDMHPLAAKIAKAKSHILTVDRRTCDEAIETLLSAVQSPPRLLPEVMSEFSADVRDELSSWFPAPVLWKLNWLLSQIRLFGNDIIVEYLEVILSSIIREVSQQDPQDLRIRRRKEPLKDAPVLELFRASLQAQYAKLRKCWDIMGRMPSVAYQPLVTHGDNRNPDVLGQLSLKQAEVDLVVTSPPYATALPYIDTDRLSLMAIMGIHRSIRNDLEEKLTGSREIKRADKSRLESEVVFSSACELLPSEVLTDIRTIHRKNSENGVGFRRENMPSLLARYFLDMRSNLDVVYSALKKGGKAYYVIGDSRTKVGEDWFHIRTADHLVRIAESCGFTARRFIDITVTTESFKHMKNAITDNVVLEFQK